MMMLRMLALQSKKSAEQNWVGNRKGHEHGSNKIVPTTPDRIQQNFSDCISSFYSGVLPARCVLKSVDDVGHLSLRLEYK